MYPNRSSFVKSYSNKIPFCNSNNKCWCCYKIWYNKTKNLLDYNNGESLLVFQNIYRIHKDTICNRQINLRCKRIFRFLLFQNLENLGISNLYSKANYPINLLKLFQTLQWLDSLCIRIILIHLN
jgi:hypothetical protein